MTTQQSSTPSVQGGQNGLAIASLVTGIVGVVFAFLFAIIGLALGIVSVALGGVARRNGDRSGRTTAGIALGAVAIVGAIVNMVVAYNMLT
ncbi:hypothetical protein DQ237_10715 [Blastococcus sp. TF02-8]|uniref:DUF4190 domain-containing protein n=1 Tax=Blastococcus sp. TF02-8 TaxID=2250574 RepID=UPI000DE8A678|nr:DUF4190 domain-containing protein [Blastococcus sp. TF02-8]RBY96314.1 hypothetical protein DQ237_10715 [Blastococcus sp. TF02-8]